MSQCALIFYKHQLSKSKWSLMSLIFFPRWLKINTGSSQSKQINSFDDSLSHMMFLNYSPWNNKVNTSSSIKANEFLWSFIVSSMFLNYSPLNIKVNTSSSIEANKFLWSFIVSSMFLNYSPLNIKVNTSSSIEANKFLWSLIVSSDVP